MKNILFVVLIPLLLAGCLSFSDTSPPQTNVIVPAQGTTVLAPGTMVVCTNGLRPPC